MKIALQPPDTSPQSSAVRSSLRLLIMTVAVGFLACACVQAEEKPVAQYAWKSLPARAAADVSSLGDDATHGSVYVVKNTANEPLRKTLLTIEAPGIDADFYRLAGEIRYEGVEADSYLEMWSTFPSSPNGGGEASYFSRTLAEAGGPMGKLRGTSDWREFSLPFNATGSGAHPVRLTFSLVLAGKGTVTVSGLKLWQGTGGATMAGAVPDPGRRNHLKKVAFWIAIISALFGGVGTVAAVLAGLRQRRQKDEARRMVAKDTLD